MRFNEADLPDDPKFLNGMELVVLKDVTRGSSQALMEEARLLRSIKGSRVVRCLGVVNEPRCRSLVLEYCDRDTIRHVVQAILQEVGPIKHSMQCAGSVSACRQYCCHGLLPAYISCLQYCCWRLSWYACALQHISMLCNTRTIQLTGL